MKHPALAHMEKRARWRWLQRYNSSWIGTVGLLVFIVAGSAALLTSGMLGVSLGLTRTLEQHGLSELAGPLAWAVGIVAGGLAFEVFRRVMINRALNALVGCSRCRCGYDLAGVEVRRCPECGAGVGDGAGEGMGGAS